MLSVTVIELQFLCHSARSLIAIAPDLSWLPCVPDVKNIADPLQCGIVM
jgi:hypothetical protein